MHKGYHKFLRIPRGRGGIKKICGGDRYSNYWLRLRRCLKEEIYKRQKNIEREKIQKKNHKCKKNAKACRYGNQFKST